MDRISMLTVVPSALAKELSKNKTVKDYNTLPQINKAILETIREYMTENVGYSNLPMACLRQSNVESVPLQGETNLLNCLPINRKESVLFQLDMPSDMIVSVAFSELLEASAEADASVDVAELEFVQDCFKDRLTLGDCGSSTNKIIFIPFLALDRCKFYAKFNEDFSTEELYLPGLSKMDVRELTSFINN